MPDTKKLVVMPAHRPELMALSLEKLSEARSTCRFKPEVHIYADSVSESTLGEMEIVRDLYLPEAFLFRAKRHLPAPSGCWNILNAIKDGARWADEVYLVEQDVLVYPYFFDWHATQTAPASCGRKLPRYEYYTNPGSCLRRPLLDALVPHICTSYFLDTGSYCERKFSTRFISTLDDGLIRRVLHDGKMGWSFPTAPVCAHIGIRSMKPKGQGGLDIYAYESETLEQRIEAVRKIVAAPQNQQRYAPEWEPFEPAAVDTPLPAGFSVPLSPA